LGESFVTDPNESEINEQKKTALGGGARYLEKNSNYRVSKNVHDQRYEKKT